MGCYPYMSRCWHDHFGCVALYDSLGLGKKGDSQDFIKKLQSSSFEFDRIEFDKWKGEQ